MDASLLTTQIRANDPRAIATAAKVGATASPDIAPLADDKKPEVRLLALACLEVTGGEAATQAGMAHVSDPDEQVEGEALQVLHHHPPVGQGDTLFLYFNTAKYPVAREQLPLVAGRLAPKVDSAPWKRAWSSEKDAVVKEHLLVALARMGDKESRETFVKSLHASQGSASQKWIDYARYMEDKWVVPPLLVMLDRMEKATDLAPDMPNTLPQRVCDLAAKAIVAIAGLKMPFPMERVNPFTADELAQIRKAAAAL
jgi:hypothetical protein